jgi:phosphoribosylaminoimidazolecarboxamide formyltransferase/IMP cyclohydrolase
MLDGRVKTLHPKIHGGLLARRDVPEHMAALEQHGIATIDLLVVNLYPFEATVAKPGCTLEDAIENIDIGGPAMVRAAAKNWKDVGVLTDAAQYARAGRTEVRRALSRRPSSRLRWPRSTASRTTTRDQRLPVVAAARRTAQRSDFPAQSQRPLRQAAGPALRREPAPEAAFYRDLHPAPGSLVTAKQLQGKELSYNNIADADAAWECVKSFDRPACVIVKHANPCGVAVGANAAEAYARRSRPTRPRPSAASSPSTASSTAPPPSRSPSSSSRC